MSKYVFKNNQRYAVYKAFKGICQWCYEFVEFKNFQVDHVLPEELLNDKPKLKLIFDTYGLDNNFNINDYENWILAHPRCNLGKSDKVYQGAGIIRTILDACAKNKELEQRTEYRLNTEPKKADLFASVQAAIELNLVNINELQNFILKTDIMESDDDDLKEIGRKLEGQIEYQSDKMVKGTMDMVKTHTVDVINSICKGLGTDWTLAWPIAVIAKPEDTKYAIRYGIKNNIDQSLGVSIVVNPDIVNNELVIKFRVGDEILEQHTQVLSKGIDWELYRKVLRQHYKSRLKEKFK